MREAWNTQQRWYACYCRQRVKSSEVYCDFCELKGITRTKFTGTCVACMGKTAWTVATSLCGSHSSRNCHLEENAPPGDVATIHTVFPIHATHVPVNFTRIMPFSPQNHSTLRCSSHVDDSNMRTIFVAYFTLLSLELHILSVVRTWNYISMKFQYPSRNTKGE